jgi:hypothetical protein
MTWKEAQNKYGKDANWRHYKMATCIIRRLWLWLGFINRKDIEKYG